MGTAERAEFGSGFLADDRLATTRARLDRAGLLHGLVQPGHIDSGSFFPPSSSVLGLHRGVPLANDGIGFAPTMMFFGVLPSTGAVGKQFLVRHRLEFGRPFRLYLRCFGRVLFAGPAAMPFGIFRIGGHAMLMPSHLRRVPCFHFGR